MSSKLGFRSLSQRVIALVGVSGVGKTTFLKRVGAACDFQHLTAGSLIAKAKSVKPAARDSLRLSDLDENQRLLVRGFTETRDPAAQTVILDGHVVIHHATGLSPIASQVFSCLGIDLIAHLEDDPARIHSNRTLDTYRKRPSLSIEVIRNHQARSLAEAHRVAGDLKIEVKHFTHEDVHIFQQILCDSE